MQGGDFERERESSKPSGDYDNVTHDKPARRGHLHGTSGPCLAPCATAERFCRCFALRDAVGLRHTASRCCVYVCGSLLLSNFNRGSSAYCRASSSAILASVGRRETQSSYADAEGLAFCGRKTLFRIRDVDVFASI